MVSSGQWKSNEIPLTRDLELKDTNSSYKAARESTARKAGGEITGMWSERKDLSSRSISRHATVATLRSRKQSEETVCSITTVELSNTDMTKCANVETSGSNSSVLTSI